jgi:hypothetical protein
MGCLASKLRLALDLVSSLMVVVAVAMVVELVEMSLV